MGKIAFFRLSFPTTKLTWDGWIHEVKGSAQRILCDSRDHEFSEISCVFTSFHFTCCKFCPCIHNAE